MKIFFQSSLPRSGSTLLQNLLGQHPDFYVTATSGVSGLLLNSRAAFTHNDEFKATTDYDRDLRAWRGYCNSAIHGYYNAITDKKYIVDKSRIWGINYDWLEKFLTYSPKIVCMVRDLRDVYASMEKNYRNNPDLHINGINYTDLTGTTLSKRIDMWSQSVPIGSSLDSLQDILSRPFASKILFIKYEGLFEDPQSTMNSVYNYLEVDPIINNFNEIEQITSENDIIHRPYGEHTIKQTLEKNNTNPTEILGDNICNFLLEKYDWFYKIFKYK